VNDEPLIIPDMSRKLWQVPADTASAEAGETWRRKRPLNFTYQGTLPQSRGSSTCRKILKGESSFTFPPKEVVPRILNALKIHCPRLGSNPRTLGMMANMIINRPQRATLAQ
jgi:hypothetical protein